MNLPGQGDYIDIHVHDGKPSAGTFILESLMAHEEKMPENINGIAYTYGIHPWFLNESNYLQQIRSVENIAKFPGIAAIGEAGFDKLRGPSPELQARVFEEQVRISEIQTNACIIQSLEIIAEGCIHNIGVFCD